MVNAVSTVPWISQVKFLTFSLRFLRVGSEYRAFSSNFGKRPLAKIGKNDRLDIKIGRNFNIEHNKGSKIYPQNQVILDSFMPSIPLKHKCLSIILIWVIVSRK